MRERDGRYAIIQLYLIILLTIKFPAKYAKFTLAFKVLMYEVNG